MFKVGEVYYAAQSTLPRYFTIMQIQQVAIIVKWGSEPDLMAYKTSDLIATIEMGLYYRDLSLEFYKDILELE